MAETVVSFVIERLGDLLINKIVFLKDVQGQVERLRDELVRIRCFLKDADQKQDDDARICHWVSEMKAASYDAEDVIEIFVSKIESIREKGFLKKLAYYPMRIRCLYRVGKDIESIQQRIIDIADSREKFGIRNLGEGTSVRGEELQRLRRSFDFSEDKDVVGFEEKTTFLVAQILKEDKGRRVFSITGMGGVGKTTLARKVYNHADVKSQFDCRAWVCVSTRYNFRDMVKTIIKQVVSISNELLDMLEKMTEHDLEQKLHECLRDKRYLVVLDDIWQEEAWDCLARVFPDESKGNRLLFTSRNQSVPLHADALSIPYELKTLGQEESWRLFLKKALADNLSGSCPLDLEDIGREIAGRCGGLPLAITIIGSLLLRKKRLESEWKSVLDNISTYLSRGQNGVSAILELSYCDLPPNLKFCFLYLGFFPDDHEISVRKLTHMWTAEGIVVKSEEKCLEDIAADYIEQLLNRNMVQVATTTVDDRIKSCRIHDLLRDLAISKGKDENFLQIHGGRDVERSGKFRYLAVHCHPQENPKFSAYSSPHLRTLLFFKMGKHVALDRLSFISFRLLRVLDLEDISIGWLPKEIGDITLLSYLGLRYTDIIKLPRSLGRLQSLQTLDVFNLLEVQIPNIIWKLESLRHLYLYDISANSPLKFEELKNLQTLSRIHCDHVMHNNLKTLTSLQKLGIWVEANSEMDKLCTSLSELGNIHSLRLYAVVNSEFPSLAGLSSFSHLNELKLCGVLKMLPPHFPPNLSRLSLTSTKLTEDPMPILAKLERLSFLKLNEAYLGNKMMISRNGFYRLNFLEFRMLDCLEEVEVEKAALPELRCLRIKQCYDLEMLPDELTSMTALEKLELVNMPKRFVSRLEGIDSYKVCRIPTVRIFADVGISLDALYRRELIKKIRTHAKDIRTAVLFQIAGQTASQ